MATEKVAMEKEEQIKFIKSEIKSIMDFSIYDEKDLMEIIHRDSTLSFLMTDIYSEYYIEVMDKRNKCARSNYQKYIKFLAETRTYDYNLRKKIISKIDEIYIQSEELKKCIDFFKLEYKIYIQDNQTLEIEEHKLIGKYMDKISSMTVQYQDKEINIAEALALLKTDDREVREIIWLKIMATLSEHKMYFNKLYGKLLRIRNQRSKICGYNNYYDYINYKSSDLKKDINFINDLYEFVKGEIVPYYKAQNPVLKKPWNIADRKKRIKKPYSNFEDLIEKTAILIGQINIEYESVFRQMYKIGHLDIVPKYWKTKNAFCLQMPYYKSAYIFMSVSPSITDIFSLFHEVGHAVHMVFLKNHRIFYNACPNSEISELIAMTFELLCLEHLEVLYVDKIHVEIVRKEYLSIAIKNLIWTSIVCCFERWNYDNPEASMDERMDKFSEIYDSLNYNKDWTGFDEQKNMMWIRQQHIFEMPFYYLNYGIAQIGAFAIYKKYKDNAVETIQLLNQLIGIGSMMSKDKILFELGIEAEYSYEFMTKTIKEVIGYLNE